jgi:hypothetical protein
VTNLHGRARTVVLEDVKMQNAETSRDVPLRGKRCPIREIILRNYTTTASDTRNARFAHLTFSITFYPPFSHVMQLDTIHMDQVCLTLLLRPPCSHMFRSIPFGQIDRSIDRSRRASNPPTDFRSRIVRSNETSTRYVIATR